MPTDTPALTFDCGCDEFQSCPRCTTQLEPNWLAKELEDVTMPNPVAEVVERLRKRAASTRRDANSAVHLSEVRSLIRGAYLDENAADLIERLSRERDAGVPEGLIVAAYIRGVEWARENGGLCDASIMPFAPKAARDYADFVLSVSRMPTADQTAPLDRGRASNIPQLGCECPAPQPPTVSDQHSDPFKPGWLAKDVERAVRRCEELGLAERQVTHPAQPLSDGLPLTGSTALTMQVSTLTRERDQAREALAPFVSGPRHEIRRVSSLDDNCGTFIHVEVRESDLDRACSIIQRSNP